ncbi:hypothetical protein P7K49_034030 [Saguinus oedipus]|uniref:Uncharacterized protein n=1 Tax=Saguinus oedipus TaxID=9490 RepID=A0ABQ9TTK9_SAGOE|nr:hypothetical protein P7K49_034030 [Saguinus oedipus]
MHGYKRASTESPAMLPSQRWEPCCYRSYLCTPLGKQDSDMRQSHFLRHTIGKDGSSRLAQALWPPSYEVTPAENSMICLNHSDSCSLWLPCGWDPVPPQENSLNDYVSDRECTESFQRFGTTNRKLQNFPGFLQPHLV